jgi:hypothetical protein
VQQRSDCIGGPASQDQLRPTAYLVARLTNGVLDQRGTGMTGTGQQSGMGVAGK